MSQTTPKTVKLYGGGCQHELPVTDAVVTPGMLVTYTASGDLVDGVRPHNVAGGSASPAFAEEYGFTGRGIDDDYAIGDRATFTVYYPGSHVYAILADAEDVSATDYLASHGDGTLKAAGADEIAVAQALEAVDTTGAPTATARIKVEIIPAQRTAPA